MITKCHCVESAEMRALGACWCSSGGAAVGEGGCFTGQKTFKALIALREAEKAGWRGVTWRYYRDVDPKLASIRNQPEFKAVSVANS